MRGICTHVGRISYLSNYRMTTSPVLASYKAPRKKKRKKHRYTSKPCLFLIPVMIGTFILLYSVRNSIHVSNKLFLKTLIMDVRETLIQHGSYYMHPGENDLDEIERYFMEEEEDDLFGVDATSTIDAVHQVGRDGLKAAINGGQIEVGINCDVVVDGG